MNLWPKSSMVFLCMMFIKTVPVHDTKMDILFSYITAASTDIPGFTLASFLSTCQFCFHFQWPVSCTRNIVFTITERPLTFTHVLGDRRSKQTFDVCFSKTVPNNPVIFLHILKEQCLRYCFNHLPQPVSQPLF